MNILVTGGAGFIGSHLAEYLLKQGYHVLVLDNLSTGRVENITHLLHHAHFEYYEGSLFDADLLEDLVDRAEIIFHLAAAVGVRLIIEDPVWTLETNVRGTEVLLRLAEKDRKRVIISSTSEVYGKSSKRQFSEADDLVLGPTVKSRWGYAASKILDEFLGMAYYRQRGVPVIIFRFFNIVGPRQTGQYGMVLPRFVQQALTGAPITVYGDGQQTRTFTHVRDAVEAMVALAFHPQAAGEIFNIGGTKEISILDLARRVKTLLQSPSPIVFVPYEEAYEEGFEDMRRRAPDLRKIQAWIGFQPKYNLDDIILDVARDLQQRLESEAKK